MAASQQQQLCCTISIGRGTEVRLLALASSPQQCFHSGSLTKRKTAEHSFNLNYTEVINNWVDPSPVRLHPCLPLAGVMVGNSLPTTKQKSGEQTFSEVKAAPVISQQAELTWVQLWWCRRLSGSSLRPRTRSAAPGASPGRTLWSPAPPCCPLCPQTCLQRSKATHKQTSVPGGCLISFHLQCRNLQ